MKSMLHKMRPLMSLQAIKIHPLMSTNDDGQLLTIFSEHAIEYFSMLMYLAWSKMVAVVIWDPKMDFVDAPLLIWPKLIDRNDLVFIDNMIG